MFDSAGKQLSNPLLLAPMAGVTVGAVRRLARRLGVAATHTEMVSAAGLTHESKKTAALLDITAEEEPCFVQYFGSDADELVQALDLSLPGRHFAGISLNMACPMPKVTKRGAGSKLMERPEVAFEMVRRVKGRKLFLCPKIRKFGGDRYAEKTRAFLEGLFEAGADMVALHGRTAAQRYDGQNDDALCDQLCRVFPGRLIISGDLFTPRRVVRALDAGAAAVMLARGFVKDPLLVPETLAVLQGRSVDCDRRMITAAFIDDLSDLPPNLALVMVKRFVPGLMKGESGVGALRRVLADVKTIEQVKPALASWLGR